MNKVRTMLGFINMVANAAQLVIWGKKAVESETGQKVIRKTAEKSKEVAGTAARSAGSLYDKACEVTKKKPAKKSDEENCPDSLGDADY